MPGMRLELEVLGDKQVLREFDRSSMRAQDAAPAFEVISHRMEDAIMLQFESEGSHGSGGWEALKPATIARKAAMGLDPHILRATNRLVNSLTLDALGEGKREFGPHEMVFGTTVPYGVLHQQGTRNMPARKPIEFTETERREFVKVLQRYIVTGAAL